MWSCNLSLLGPAQRRLWGNHPLQVNLFIYKIRWWTNHLSSLGDCPHLKLLMIMVYKPFLHHSPDNPICAASFVVIYGLSMESLEWQPLKFQPTICGIYWWLISNIFHLTYGFLVEGVDQLTSTFFDLHHVNFHNCYYLCLTGSDNSVLWSGKFRRNNRCVRSPGGANVLDHLWDMQLVKFKSWLPFLSLLLVDGIIEFASL